MQDNLNRLKKELETEHSQKEKAITKPKNIAHCLLAKGMSFEKVAEFV